MRSDGRVSKRDHEPRPSRARPRGVTARDLTARRRPLHSPGELAGRGGTVMGGTDRPPLRRYDGRTLGLVERTNDIAEFLTSRRGKVTPEQAGLPTYGKRRVPGLRRDEVASIAGVSVEYYKRLERGNLSGVSELVLEGLAGALQLDDAERAHLFDLARAASPVSARRSRPVKQNIRPVVQRILDQIAAPATVRNARLDYLGANALGRALYAPVFDGREQPPNSARFTFLDPAAADVYPE